MTALVEDWRLGRVVATPDGEIAGFYSRPFPQEEAAPMQVQEPLEVANDDSTG